jgi:hypothetical protein
VKHADVDFCLQVWAVNPNEAKVVAQGAAGSWAQKIPWPLSKNPFHGSSQPGMACFPVWMKEYRPGKREQKG